jgi:hypothetical protein
MTSAYDAVRYPSLVHPGSHPARLSALASLYGRTSPPAWRCRVLEIGCGDGANHLSLAAAAPLSRSPRASARSRARWRACRQGETRLATLHHKTMEIAEPAGRHFEALVIRK